MDPLIPWLSWDWLWLRWQDGGDVLVYAPAAGQSSAEIEQTYFDLQQSQSAHYSVTSKALLARLEKLDGCYNQPCWLTLTPQEQLCLARHHNQSHRTGPPRHAGC